ncbi:uncharacterized protein LOC144022059 [Festucalex cinctus]
MSVQYTIDIQLTELGFPDVLQPPESLSTSCDDSQSPCLSPALTTPPDPPRESRLVKSQPSKQPKGQQVRASPALRASPSQQLQPSQSGQEAGGAATPLREDGNTPAAPQQQSEESDSDDSDVSMVCQEDEDEEDDYEDEDNEPANSGDHVCGVCGLRFSSDFKLQDHVNLHTGARPYCCAECGKRFSQIHNYRVHLRTHRPKKTVRPHCRICLMSFASHKSLEHHLSVTHFEHQFYECDLCKRVFTNLKACEHHVALHSSMPEVVCEKCGRHFTQAKSLKRHQKKACYRVFKCTDCAETFGNKNSLLKHSFSHLGLLPYTCVSCRCHFRLAKLYRQHKCEPWRIHCVACLREFSNQGDFLRHKKDTGCWGSRDVKGDEIRCLECGLSFSTSEELKKHAGAHQRVLKCAECGKGFRSALLLMSHMGGHAGNSPCLCQSCGLGFPHQQNYDSHLKTCGQTPQTNKPATATKKQASLKKPLETIPPASTRPVQKNNPASSPVANSALLQLAAGDNPASDGCWKLTLDKMPPPGSNLLLFVPANTEGLALPPGIAQVVPDVQNLAAHQTFVPAQQLGVQPPIQDADFEPMDLSKKASDPTPPVVKSEPVEDEMSGEAISKDGVMDLSTAPIKKSEPPSVDSF